MDPGDNPSPARLVLEVAGAELVVAPAIGGALAAWRWHGRDMLRETAPAAFDAPNVRLMASYPLVPWSNRIRDGRFEFEGIERRLAANLPDQRHPIHGVGWQQPWEVSAQFDRDHLPSAEELAVLELSGFDGDATEFASGGLGICLLEYENFRIGAEGDAWPWAFAAQQCLTLTPEFLALTMTVENRDDTTMPVGFGWHPYFPKADAEIDIEVAGVWHGDPDRLPVGYESPAPWSISSWVRAASLDLDHCFLRDRGGRLAIRWSEAGTGIEIIAEDVFRHVVVYCPPDRDFFAVEPVTQMNDAFNQAMRGNPDTGILSLAPGADITGTIVLRPFAFDPALARQ